MHDQLILLSVNSLISNSEVEAVEVYDNSFLGRWM